jgi:hypothetical protein
MEALKTILKVRSCALGSLPFTALLISPEAFARSFSMKSGNSV